MLNGELQCRSHKAGLTKYWSQGADLRRLLHKTTYPWRRQVILTMCFSWWALLHGESL